MLKFVLPALALSLAGCAASADGGQSASQPALTDIQQRALQGRALAEPVSCITSNDILDTDAVGDRVVLFHMRNGWTYRNDLPDACPALRRKGAAFSYRTVVNRLCDVDVIDVFEPSQGFSYGGCRLGRFTRYELPEGVNRNSL